MATLTMSPPPLPSPSPSAVRPPVARSSRDASPQEIIEAARAAPATAISAALTGSLGSLLMWAAFTPLDWGPLGWVCLVPLLCLVRIERPTRAMYRAVYVAGLVFWLPALQWMRLGDPTMYGAWALLAAYCALYFPAFIGLSRIAVHQLRVPLIVAAPVVWTGLELFRGHFLTGFPWYYLGHTQYRWTELIQISDITGAYGVSFVLALAAACVAAALPASWLSRMGLLPPGTPTDSRDSATSVVVAACVSLATLAIVLAYGYWRRAQADFQPGPRVAMIQAAFPASARPPRPDISRIFRTYDALTGVAVREQPDLIVWPEGMFPYPMLHTRGATDEQLDERFKHLGIKALRNLDVPQALEDLSLRAGAALIVGQITLDVDPQRYRLYNSATFVRADGVAGRYDKMHRVVFGEYIPFAEQLPFLQAFTPYRGPFGIAAGSHGSVFDYRGVRYAPVICFEDTVPYVVRGIARGTRDAEGRQHKVDVLVNLTNDGWFHGSSEHDQHLITAAFRCVELRTPMVRAVNTGVSAVIDGDGVIRARAKDIRGSGKSKLVEAVLVENVPLDRRASLYLAGGDWFPALCLAGTLFFGGMGLAGRWRRKA